MREQEIEIEYEVPLLFPGANFRTVGSADVPYLGLGIRSDGCEGGCLSTCPGLSAFNLLFYSTFSKLTVLCI